MGQGKFGWDRLLFEGSSTMVGLDRDVI